MRLFFLSLLLIFLSLLLIVISVTGCINSSTAFAWRSVSYQSTPEAGHSITQEERPGAATVNAEKTTSDAFKMEPEK